MIEPKYAIEVQPYKGSLWVQRGRLFYTKEEADIAVHEFTDGSPTGPWKGARVRPVTIYELIDWRGDDDPTFCLLECPCGRRSQRLDEVDDHCGKCGDKMRVIKTYLASDY